MATLKAHGLLIIDQINAHIGDLVLFVALWKKRLKALYMPVLTGFQFLGFSYFVSRAT